MAGIHSFPSPFAAGEETISLSNSEKKKGLVPVKKNYFANGHDGKLLSNIWPFKK